MYSGIVYLKMINDNKTGSFIITLIIFGFITANYDKEQPQANMLYSEASDKNALVPKRKMLAHYMPWYTSKPFSGKWGWHWTMDHYNPDEVLANGQLEVASYYYPLIGPYDSGDPDALECHVLLMKFAGIDGVIIDWYGIEDFYDYSTINRNTQHIINYAREADLEFAICYEDQSIKRMVENGYIAGDKAVEHGQRAMLWLQSNCFDSQAYLKIDGRPALFVFGPQYFTSDQWNQLFSVLPNRPFLYVLNYLQDGADGIFGWPPVNGNITAPEQWNKYLESLYDKNGKSCVGVVFPQFHDIYGSAGVHKSYGFIDAQGTETFEETLGIAIRSNCELIQIATWNDYGEGTIIEPTVEFGYSYLEKIQRIRKQEFGVSFPYKAGDLRLPIMLYQLKKKYQHNRSVMHSLSKCSELLFSRNIADAEKLMKSYQ